MKSYMNILSGSSVDLLAEKTSLYIEKCSNEIESDVNFIKIIEYKEACGTFFENGDESVDLKKKSFISNAIEKIMDILKKIKEYISSFLVGLGNKITENEYLSSETAQIRFNSDVQYIYDFLDKKYLEARPIVKKISKLTGKNAEDVASFCDSVTNFVAKKGKTVLKVGVILFLANKIKKKTEGLLHLSNETEGAINQIKGKNIAGQNLSLLSRFANSLFGLTRLAGSLTTDLFSALNLYNKESNKKNKRR